MNVPLKKYKECNTNLTFSAANGMVISPFIFLLPQEDVGSLFISQSLYRKT